VQKYWRQQASKPMRQNKNSFRHESQQNAKTIQETLKCIAKGITKGKLSFSDEDGEIVMEPEGLLNLKVTASPHFSPG
jgi:amphi-Trp domain-containing protein